MNRILFLATLALAAALPTAAFAQKDVWIDADASIGIPGGEVDDGVAIVQAFNSPQIKVRGVSAVYGNAAMVKTAAIAGELLKKFGPETLEVKPGAASAKDLGIETEAVIGMTAGLRKWILTIVALGPATNVATLVSHHPELHKRIERIVLVAGRRPGQKFIAGPAQKLPFRDFNFELDPVAVKLLLESPIEIVLAPWEVSSQVLIEKSDLEAIQSKGKAGRFLSGNCSSWIDKWRRDFGAKGFTPFDALAVGWVARPELIESVEATARVENGPDDTAKVEGGMDLPRKPYLLVDVEGKAEGRKVRYLTKPKPEFKAALMETLGAPDKPVKPAAK